MSDVSITHSRLHCAIARHFLEHGVAPSIDRLCVEFGDDRPAVVAALRALEAYHGVVLHPKSSEVWALHPFSAAPTSFWVQSRRGGWWGNCAWCALGIAALVDEDASITTTLGGESEQVVIRIASGRVIPESLRVHFPIPMTRAWDNVTYTCSMMLVFASDAAIGEWCTRHGIAQGDTRSLADVWEFARVWYGRHLDPGWKKWTATEAHEIFSRFHLAGPIWEVPITTDRF
jgi:hypothetical protein